MVGNDPTDIQINEQTNKIYVANSASGSVSVIDSDSGSIKTIRVGVEPFSIAIDDFSNKIYVTNRGSNSVSVIDGYNDNKTKDIPVDNGPINIAADPNDHKIYVTHGGNNSLTVIDGYKDRKIKDIPFGDQIPETIVFRWPVFIVRAQSPNNILNGTVSTIDPTDDRINPGANKIPVGSGSAGLYPPNIAVGYQRDQYNVLIERLSRIYVGNSFSNTVSVLQSGESINGSRNLPIFNRSQDIPALGEPSAITSDLSKPLRFIHQIVKGIAYVVNSESNAVSVINMANDTKERDIPVGNDPQDISLGNISNYKGYHKVYVANTGSNSVSIINRTTDIKNITLAISPKRIAFNPIWNMIYVLGLGGVNALGYQPGAVSVIDGATDKVAVGIIFKVNPENSGSVTCNDKAYPANTYMYVDSGTDCKVQTNNGFDFSNWVESPLTNRNSSIPLEPSSNPENLIVDRYGIFIANFKEERPLSAQDLFTYLTGAISAAVAINGALLVVPGWRRARKQRTHLRECIKMIDNDVGKSHKDAIEEKIFGYYVDGKLSEDHRQLLNDKISEYYGSVKGSESGEPFG